MRARVAPDPGNGRLVMCAPDEVDRLARDQARSGEHAFPLGAVSAGERSVERTEDSGP